MDKTLATLVKALAGNYSRIVEQQRFNGMMPKTLHMRALRGAADEIIVANAEHKPLAMMPSSDELDGSPKETDSK